MSRHHDSRDQRDSRPRSDTNHRDQGGHRSDNQPRDSPRSDDRRPEARPNRDHREERDRNRRPHSPADTKPAFRAAKREQSRSPDTNAKRRRNRYAHEEADDGSHEWGKPSTSKPPAASSGGGGGGFKQPGGHRQHSAAAADATDDAAAPPAEKEQPNFGLSGKLTEDTNKVNGTVLKYSEPEEARIPKRRWRLYPFKGDEALPRLFIHRQSCFLVGRDRQVCDIPVDHPSCSKQHAVLQYRLVGYQREDGSKGKIVRPYLLDLESANGTYLNNQRIEARKYVQVLEKDVIKFGYSSREYVMLHENSKDEEDIDVQEATPPLPTTTAGQR